MRETVDRFRARGFAYAALFAAVAAGALLRLIWMQDMEFKGDERWTFQQMQRIGSIKALPWLGMPTSCEVLHPGGTVWVFVGLGKLFHVHSPPGLGRACQLLNISAILLLVAFACLLVPRPQREPWLWAAALVAVNPLAVVLHRKIWPPSIMPAFIMVTLICWWYRRSRGGAFAWGLVGALLGFIYPAGLFFAAGFAAWAFLFDRHGVHWRYWLAGSCLGALPLIPWFVYVWNTLGSHPLTEREWSNLLGFPFWLRWVTEPFGLSLNHVLGRDFLEFLGYPHLLGRPTYLVALLHGALVLAALGLVGWAVRQLWRQRQHWGALWIGRESATAFTQSAGMWGFGIALTASLLPIHRYYMGVTFPLMFLWLARLALAHQRPLVGALTTGRTLLLGMCVAQLLISASFLVYVHRNQRALHGDYGTPYGAGGPFPLHGGYGQARP